MSMTLVVTGASFKGRPQLSFDFCWWLKLMSTTSLSRLIPSFLLSTRFQIWPGNFPCRCNFYVLPFEPAVFFFVFFVFVIFGCNNVTKNLNWTNDSAGYKSAINVPDLFRLKLVIPSRNFVLKKFFKNVICVLENHDKSILLFDWLI
jgi:hypothetical protein